MYIMSFENILIVLIKTYGSTVYNHTLKKTQISEQDATKCYHIALLCLIIKHRQRAKHGVPTIRLVKHAERGNDFV